MRIERDEMTLRHLTPHCVLYTLHVCSPSLWNEFPCVGAPDIRICVYAECIPAYPRVVGDEDFPRQNGLLCCDAVDQLGDGWVETEELEDHGVQVGKRVDCLCGRNRDARCEDLGAEFALDWLVLSEDVEG